MLPLEGAPLTQQVTVHWDTHQIPFIEAATDDDLAVALGIVHAHLRLGQMELLRRLSQGRLSEVLGRLGLRTDRLVRTFDIGRATPQILSLMPAETRQWLEAFVRGINHYLTGSPTLPYEFRLLKMPREQWRVSDIITLERLVAADLNWLVWLRLFGLRGDPEWPHLWQRVLRQDALSCWEESAGSPSSPSEMLILGRHYRFADLPASGTSETLMKTASGLTNRRHSASYGSVARHITDLSEPDRNYFVLLGGQDGWFGSTNFLDQLGLWRRCEYIVVPLTADAARTQFNHHTTLIPARVVQHSHAEIFNSYRPFRR
jgi:penicillin amidase